ncbi:MAG: LysM peptidoglycan-binding domain-containing protein [Lentisphaerae bacterium]|nr:LysM peptidoglycan-binding domain-containing protein [Lentisphaerota bacterium]
MTSRLFTRLGAGLVLGAVALLLVGLGGCSGEALVDERNIYYIRGVKLREQKNHEEAAEAFATCLRLSPQSAQAHLQLALLYDEPLNDPLTAVYHYRHFLEMRPDDPNAAAARDWLAKAERKLLNRLQQAAVYAAMQQVDGAAASVPENAAARELELLARVQELSLLNDQLRSRLDAPGAAVPSTSGPAPTALAGAAPPSAPSPAAVASAPVAPPPAAFTPVVPAPAAPSPPPAPSRPAAPPPGLTPPTAPARVAPSPGTRFHVVVKGDTLSSLSRRYYGSMSHWPQLKQVNHDILGGRDDLRLGQRLRIPPLEEIRALGTAGARTAP